jgi:hypothetical protein
MISTPLSVILESPIVVELVNLVTLSVVPPTATELPDVPLEPDVPELPAPLEPEVPELPLAPEAPLVPEVPLATSST